jgi:hypothetical protein
MQTPFTHPYQKDAPSSLGEATLDRIFLRTTRAVEADEEIVVNYGKGYWKGYWNN